MWEIIWISFLSGMATPVGGWMVLRFRRLSKNLLALFLGLAAGIMVTVVISELMPRSLQAGGQKQFWIGSIAGWLFMQILRAILQSIISNKWGKGDKAALLQMGWFITLAIALHDMPEGLAIGAGDAVQHEVGLIIALAIALHNIPEGMSIAVPLRMAGVNSWKVFWITFLAGLTTPLGTIIYLGLFTISPAFISGSLAFASGAMVYVVAQSILPEALQANKWVAMLGIGCGALIMALLSFIQH